MELRSRLTQRCASGPANAFTTAHVCCDWAPDGSSDLRYGYAVCWIRCRCHPRFDGRCLDTPRIELSGGASELHDGQSNVDCHRYVRPLRWFSPGMEELAQALRLFGQKLSAQASVCAVMSCVRYGSEVFASRRRRQAANFVSDTEPVTGSPYVAVRESSSTNAVTVSQSAPAVLGETRRDRDRYP